MPPPVTPPAQAYTCKYCKKTFTHAPAHVQHERAHVQQMHSPDPQSRIYTSAEGRTLLQADPPRAPEGWVREIMQRKDSGRKDIVYHKSEDMDPGQPALILRSATEAQRWLKANPACGLTIDAFDFVVRKGDKVTAGGVSYKTDDSDEDLNTLDVSNDSAALGEGAPGATNSAADNGGRAGNGKGSATTVQGENGASKKSKKSCGTSSVDATAPPRADVLVQEARGESGVAATLNASKRSDEPTSGGVPAHEDLQEASAGPGSGGIGAVGGERQKRERKQTAFYDPQRAEGDGPAHTVNTADSPAATCAARQAQPPKKMPGDAIGGSGVDAKSNKKRKVSGGLAVENGGAGGRGEGGEEQAGNAGPVSGVVSADASAEDLHPCPLCRICNKGVAQCFGQGHILVKHDGSRPVSCASCRQRNKGALHCFKRGHMQGMLRCPTLDDMKALSQVPLGTLAQGSRMSREQDTDGARQAGTAEGAKGGGKKGAVHSNVAETLKRSRASGQPPDSTSPATANVPENDEPGASGDADAGVLAEGSERRARLVRGSADHHAAGGSYRNNTYTTTASHRSARPSFRENRDREREREARERGLDLDAEHMTPAAQPIVLWETVINRMSRRCSTAYLRDKGKVEEATPGDGEEAATAPAKRFLSAAAYGDAEVAQGLLREGVDVNARDELQHTALHHAAAAGDVALSRLLIDGGADVSARGVDGDDACHVAASQGHEEVLQLLMDKGASIDVFNRDRLTARHVVNLLADEILYVTQQAASDSAALQV